MPPTNWHRLIKEHQASKLLIKSILLTFIINFLMIVTGVIFKCMVKWIIYF